MLNSEEVKIARRMKNEGHNNAVIARTLCKSHFILPFTSQKDGTLPKFLEKLAKIDLLICDEWGYTPLDRQGAQLLFQVITERYENKSIAITTNLDFGKWNGIFCDEKITNAIIDRLIHHCHLIVFEGPSYRLEHSYIKA